MGNPRFKMSTKIFTIVFVLCMLSVFNCGKLQGSTSDFDKVANGIEDKLAAFKQEFENKLAQKNLTEDQQEKVLEHVGKKFMEIVDNTNKKWESFQGQLKKADKSTREHMMEKFHEISDKVHQIEKMGQHEERKMHPRGKGKGKGRGKGKGPRGGRRDEDDDDRRPPRRNDTDEDHHESNETEHEHPRKGREQEDDDEDDIGRPPRR